MAFFEKAIETMAASSLRCVAIAYRSYESEKVPTNEEELAKWALPEDDLVLLAVVGIKVSLEVIMHSFCVIFFVYIIFMICIWGVVIIVWDSLCLFLCSYMEEVR